MKKRIIPIIVIFLTISVVSAAYTCTGTLSEDSDEIQMKDRESINGLGISLIYSDETAIFNKFSADIFVDSIKATITNESEEFELKSEVKSMRLTNSSSINAKIEIGGSSETLEIDESGKIGGLEVYLLSTEGTYPEGSADILVGKTKVSLSNDANPDEIATIDEINYLIELKSASDNNAIINVKKCSGGEFTETKEEAEVPIENNKSEQNLISELNISEENETSENDTVQESQEIEAENLSSENQKIKVQGQDYSAYIYIGIIAILVILIIFLLLYFRSKLKGRGEEQEVKKIIDSKR